jgi:hypothetical protein
MILGKINHKKKFGWKQIAVFGLGFIVLAYFQINIHYQHSHVLADGRVIYHAHPYSAQHQKNHSHNAKEYAFFSLFVHAKTDIKNHTFNFFVPWTYVVYVEDGKNNPALSEFTTYFQLRAPPLFLYM